MYYVLALTLLKITSVRVVLSTLTACILSMVSGKLFIEIFEQRSLGQTIRLDGPESHLVKEGTPTMGGLFIMLSVVLTLCVWIDFLQPWVLISVTALILFGGIGLLDDVVKLRRSSAEGLRMYQKILLQTIVSGFIVYLVSRTQGPEFSMIWVPWRQEPVADLGGWYPVLGTLFLVFYANSVNLSDGLDGLAGGLASIVLVCLTFAAFVFGAQLTRLSGHSVEQYQELGILGMTIVGAVVGFLWYNTKPAQVFMGDTGSQSLGGVIGTMSMLMHSEILAMIIGAVFMMESLSVLIQVGSYKLRQGKRVFRMAPLHHHFEKMGMHESKIVSRFRIAGVLSASTGVLLILLRV